MNFTNSSPEHIKKVTSDNAALGFDLLSNLIYMKVLIIGGLSRDKLFALTSQQSLKTAAFFDYVGALVVTAGFEYTEAFKAVASQTRSSVVKSLLLRFSAAISSGESEQEFIVQESSIALERYQNEYERSVENLRKWTDAYSAILVSVTLVMVVCLISTIMAAMNGIFITMVAISVSLITGMGVYIIYKVSPSETFSYTKTKSIAKEWQYTRWILMVLTPIGLILALVLGMKWGFTTGCAVAFTMVGSALLPTGIIALRDDMNIRDIDSQLHTFLRTIGNIIGATGANLSEGISQVDIKSMGFLGIYLNRLRLRLGAQLSSEDSWEKFREETGSELVSRTTHMMVDASNHGGNPEEVGQICSDYALSVVQLREKRRLVSSTFNFLIVPMHLTMTFILVFVLEILVHFNDKLSEIPETGILDVNDPVLVPVELELPPGIAIANNPELAMGLNIFNSQNLDLVTGLIVAVILMITVANGIAPKYASGGNNLKIAFFLSLMCFVSGTVIGVVPLISDQLFSL